MNKTTNRTKRGGYISFILFYCKLHKKGYKYIAKYLYWVNRLVFCCDIPPTVAIGKNLILPHYGLGVVIHPNTVIGDNVRIYQSVTIGSRIPGKGCIVEIRNNVMLGAGCKILGSDHLIIGDGVKVGANSVVLKSIKNNVTVVGIPAVEK